MEFANEVGTGVQGSTKISLSTLQVVRAISECTAPPSGKDFLLGLAPQTSYPLEHQNPVEISFAVYKRDLESMGSGVRNPANDSIGPVCGIVPAHL